DRWAIRISRDVADAADGPRDAAEARMLALGSRLPEGGDAHHHQPRVHARQLVVAETPALHRAGTEVLGEDVGAGGEPGDEGLTLGLAQVARDGLLVSPLDPPHVPDTGGGLVAEPREVVAAAGLLDLDHVGAELGEQRAAEGRGDEGREVERYQTLQCSAHLVSANHPRDVRAASPMVQGATIAQMVAAG